LGKINKWEKEKSKNKGKKVVLHQEAVFKRKKRGKTEMGELPGFSGIQFTNAKAGGGKNERGCKKKLEN